MAIKLTRKGILVEGSAVTIMSDLTNITRAVKEAFINGGLPEEVAKEMVDKSVEIGLLSEEELDKKAKEALGSILRTIADGLEEDTAAETKKNVDWERVIEEVEMVQKGLEENEAD